MTDKSKASKVKKYFGGEAEQTAQRVVPLAPDMRANGAPTVAMRTEKKRVNPFILAAVFALTAVTALAIFYTASNRQVKSASTQTEIEENKIDPVVVNVPQTLKTQNVSSSLPAENLSAAASSKSRKRESRAAQNETDAPVLIYEDEEPYKSEENPASDKEVSRQIERAIPRIETKGKKQEKLIRKAERAREKVKEIKDIFDEFDDNLD